MPVSLSCPACGAPLDPAMARGAHVTCAFCGRSVVVPDTAGSGTPPSPSPFRAPAGALETELRALLAREQKIEAIKRYREEFGAPLRVAKKAVDSLETGAGLLRPEEIEPPGSAGASTDAGPSPGCILAVVLFLALGALGLWLAP